MTLVLSIDQLAGDEAYLVGGKASSLGKMHKAGIRVPCAICVTTEAYRSFLAQTGLSDKILLEIERKAFSEMRWEELWDSSLRLRNLFLTTPVPSELREMLGEVVEQVFRDSPVAVRSSAPGEDSSRMSFAGLHESYLHVSGIEGILDHVRLVWASLFSDRALLYRQELGLDPRQSTMAVVIQGMIDGERSGVVFGMSPTDPEQAVVESVHGLNQDLVDGLVEPHRWILDRHTGGIISFSGPDDTNSTGHEEHARSSAHSGTISAPLDERQVGQVFDLSRRTEELFGCPQDVEWTYRGTTLFALQSRPITSGEAVPGDERRWYLTLRRTYENLLELREEIESTLLPAMQMDASELTSMDLATPSDEDLTHEIERRKGILDYWEQTYKEKCIPFAHGMRLFAEVYNDQVRPDDPFEFMDLLGASDMLSVKRNNMLRELALILQQDSASLQCLYQDHVDECGENVLKVMREFRDAFGDLAWGSASLFNDSSRMATLMRSYIEMGSQLPPLETKTAEGLTARFFASFPEHRKDYASTLLDVARASYRLRDDDNIYIGKIRRRIVDAEEEARRRGILEPLNPCCGEGPAGALPCKDDSETLSQYTPVLPIGSHDPIFNIQARQVVGQPAGAGLATGKARVIRQPEDLFEFRAREILVCDAIDPNMTFVVPLASGIVERRGGMLIHGAIIAREYGIPCVTGVPAATDVIRTGDTVTVDGFLGIVIIG
jgi:phosphohistidine swiveling domain-containing protein